MFWVLNWYALICLNIWNGTQSLDLLVRLLGMLAMTKAVVNRSVNKQPHSVILLDEVEKAHPDVFNLLLQVMDHGTLTDNNGRKADFRNVILIMTTNAGAELMSRSSIGFATQDHRTDGMEAIKKMFTPEFRNRLDSIVQFSELGMEVIKTVVDKFLVQLQSQLDDKKVFHSG